MHILQSLINYPPRSFGGTEQYVHGLAHALQSRGCTVTVSATSDREYSYTHDGVQVYRYPSTPTPSQAEMRGERPPLHFEVFARWLREAQVDVMHMHAVSRAIGLYHAEYARSLGIPLVLTVHIPGITCIRGTMIREGREVCDGQIIPRRCAACKLQSAGLPVPVARGLSYMPAPLATIAERFEHRAATALSMTRFVAAWAERMKRLFALADKIVAVSQWLYEVLLLNGVPADKLILSRHGLAAHQIVAPRAGGRTRGQPLVVGFIGRFHPTKGAHVLVQAVTSLPHSVPVELCVYGLCNDRMEEGYLASLKQMAGDDRRITFPGPVTTENRAQVFAGIDALAVPSQWLETGPLVALEAFATGLPVVGSNMGGLAELVTHEVDGLLVPPTDIGAWAHALTRLAQEPGLLERLRQSIGSVRTSIAVADEMLAIYSQLVRSPVPTV